MSANLRYSMHLAIDPHPKFAGWRGYLGPGLAVFARPSVTYQDLLGHEFAEPYSADRLFAAFLDAAGRRFERLLHSLDLEVLKSRVIDTAREAFGRFPEACEANIGMMELTLVSAPERSDRLGLAHIGAGVALRIAAGDVSLVVEPHSPHYGSNPADLAEVGDHALVSLATLEPQLEYAGEIRAAEVELKAGEWLVVAPGSSSVVQGLVLSALPASIGEIEREVIDRLAAPYAAYPRSWLAISARDIHGP